MTNTKNIFEQMFSDAPAAVTRQEIANRTSNAISPKTLANRDSLGIGIAGRFVVGRKVLYPTANVIDWLKNRAVSNG